MGAGLRCIAVGVVAAGAILVTSTLTLAEERPGRGTIVLSAGLFGAIGAEDHAALASVGYYRQAVGPILGQAIVLVSSDRALFVGAGVGARIRLGRHLVLTPTFAPGYYSGGRGRALGLPLEFRSQLEVAWRFDAGIRVGLALAHLSNGGLGSANPGTESFAVACEIPLHRTPHGN